MINGDCDVIMIVIMWRVVQGVWPDGSSHSNFHWSKLVIETWQIPRTFCLSRSYLLCVQQYKLDIFSKWVFHNLSFMEELLRSFFISLSMKIFFFFETCCGLTRAMAFSFLRFLDHAQQRTTFDRTLCTSQRPLPENTQPSQWTNIRASGGIRTHNLSRRVAADPSLRPRGHCDLPWIYLQARKQRGSSNEM